MGGLSAGTVTAFSVPDGVGRITLEDGRELRFGASVCVGFQPVVGQRVWVGELEPHPLGGLRATSVHASASGTLTRLELAAERQRLDEQLGAKLVAFAAEPPPLKVRVPGVKETLKGLGLKPPPLLFREGRLAGWEPPWVDDLEAWIPFDPCFVACLAADGDALGFFLHPDAVAIRRDPLPIVRFEHETNRLSFEAWDLPTALFQCATAGREEEEGDPKYAKEKVRIAKLCSSEVETLKGHALTAWETLLEMEAPHGASAATERERAAVMDVLDAAYTPNLLSAMERMAAVYDDPIGPEVLRRRARAQVERAHREAFIKAERARISREHYEANPEVYADKLRPASPP